MTLRIPAAMAAASIAIGTVFALPATAAEQSAAPRLAQADAYADDKLQSFAVAAIDVELLRQQFLQELAQVDDDDTREEIAQQANEQMRDAVETAPGITIEEYNEIVQAAEQNPALAQRIAQHMQPMME